MVTVHPALRPTVLPAVGALASALLAVLLSLAAAEAVIPVAVMDWPHEEQRVPVAELLCVCAATAGAWFLRPRMWEWERLGGLRTRVRACSVASLGLLLPTGAAFVLAALAPPVEHPWLTVTNVFLATACVHALAPLVGAISAGVTVLSGILLGAVLCNVVPGAHRVWPYAYANGDGWVPADLLWSGVLPLTTGMAVVLVLTVHALTHGATTHARGAETD